MSLISMIKQEFSKDDLLLNSDYLASINWLFEQTPNYETMGVGGYKPGLDNINALCEHFGNPEKHLKMIHIGGTNGKGSSCHMLSSVLQESGYKVGLFCSPHLVDFRERIKVNSSLCDAQFVFDFIQKLKNIPKTIQPSFFEFSTMMAFEYFKLQKVDYAIIEVGLGGRLDSTNIITPLLTGITNVDLDHQNLLGHDILSIAHEKAGIIKANVPLVIGETHIEVQNVFVEKALSLNSPYFLSEPNNTESDLKGKYQSKNIGFVLKIIEVLNTLGFMIPEKSIEIGFKNVIKNTQFMGRWSVLSQEPLLICDTAHNLAGMQQVLDQLNAIPMKKHFILGFVNDKKIDELLELLPKKDNYYFVKPQNLRGQDPKKYKELLEIAKINYLFFETTWEAYLFAIQELMKNEMIFVGGSNFIVGDFLKKYLEI